MASRFASHPQPDPPRDLTTVVAALHASAFCDARHRRAPFVGVGGGHHGLVFLAREALVQRFRDRLRPESLQRLVKGMGWTMIAIGACS
jgi:hypothetical protein